MIKAFLIVGVVGGVIVGVAVAFQYLVSLFGLDVVIAGALVVFFTGAAYGCLCDIEDD